MSCNNPIRGVFEGLSLTKTVNFMHLVRKLKTSAFHTYKSDFCVISTSGVTSPQSSSNLSAAAVEFTILFPIYRTRLYLEIKADLRRRARFVVLTRPFLIRKHAWGLAVRKVSARALLNTASTRFPALQRSFQGPDDVSYNFRTL